jgi:hypothetical protein
MNLLKSIKPSVVSRAVLLLGFYWFGAITFSTAATAAAQPLTVTCGKAKMSLYCTGSDCGATSLSLTSGDAKPIKISRPEGLERYTAVGLSCAKATDNTPYFVVQYGERPEGCAFCEWFHLYSTEGQLLTKSIPAILTDSSAREGHQQMPNNMQFDALDRKLGLGRPKMRYVDNP